MIFQLRPDGTLGKGTKNVDKLQNKLSEELSGPLLFNYVWWILKEAQERGFQTLYFLARDGCLLREIAQQFCTRFQLPVECRYLYCSRASLRTPSYHLIGTEAHDLLLQGGYCVTLRSLLQRAALSEEQQEQVCADCGFGQIEWDRTLSRIERAHICAVLRSSDVWNRFIQEKSKNAYQFAVGYLAQEGLLERREVVLVDSGWTGSMQRSMRQLLESAGFSGRLTGLYFGMYAAPKSEADGKYLTWYFDHTGRTADKILFCNNLFECLLSAPHGMTTGYIFRDGGYQPDCLPEPQGQQQIREYMQLVLQYTERRLRQTRFSEFHEERLKEDTRKRIARYMAHPDAGEAAAWGRFLFCDDITETYHLPLADPGQLEYLKNYNVPLRVLRRILKRPGKHPAQALYWPYGTIAFLPRWKRPWYRWNIYIWEWIRYVLR